MMKTRAPGTVIRTSRHHFPTMFGGAICHLKRKVAAVETIKCPRARKIHCFPTAMLPMLFAVWNHKETAGAEGKHKVAASATSRFLRFRCDFLIASYLRLHARLIPVWSSTARANRGSRSPRRCRSTPSHSHAAKSKKWPHWFSRRLAPGMAGG